MNYLINLYARYCLARGICFDIRNILNDNEFYNWIIKLKKNTKTYELFLEYLGIIFSKYSTIELNKGKYDTLDNTTKISLYTKPRRNLEIYRSLPIIIDNASIYEASNFSLFLTHNPLKNEDIIKLIQLHKLGLNIILGMYGKLSDKDKRRKLEVLKTLQSTLSDTSLHVETLDDNYFACLKDKDHIKERILVKR